MFASEKARIFRIHVGGEPLRVTVPKTFEPLLPGSVYPNRRRPVEATQLPVAIIDREADPTREFLLERKFLVVERRWAPVTEILAALASHPEADTSRTVVIAIHKLPALPPRVRAAAIFDPDLDSKGPESETASEIAVFLRTPARAPSEELSRLLSDRFGPNPIEKWYRGDKGFPEQAYRDAAEMAAAAAR